MKKNSKIILICDNCYSRNYSYDVSGFSQRNNKLMLKKFCKNCNSHTLHKETR